MNEIRLINEYKKGVKLEVLSSEYGISIVEIHDIFQKHNESMSREDWGKVSSKKQTFHIDRRELYDRFITQNNTRKEVAKHFGCSEALIKKRCQEWGIKKSSNQFIKNSEKTMLKKYGTTTISNINREQRDQTNIDRYGSKTPFESWEIQNKIVKNRILTIEESIIARILEDNNYNWISEYSFRPDKESERVILSFDFAVKDDYENIMFLIELDGFYHHSHNAYDKQSFDSIIRHKKADLEKLRFCQRNEIPLLTINEIIGFESEDDIVNLIDNFNNKINK